MSTSDDRMATAEVRATTAYRSVCNKADAVLEELDGATDPNGIPTVEIHEEDSLVTAIDEAMVRKKRRAASSAG